MENSFEKRQPVTSEDEGHLWEIRAPSELALRETGLLELVEILEELKVAYFLADGTLLGAARNGDFIPWDPDVAIWIKAEIFSRIKDELIKNLASQGFSIDAVGGRNPKLNVFKYSEKFELEAWRLSGKNRVRGGLWAPAHLLDNPGQIKLRGRLYPCPSPVNEFLSHRYGSDWRIPQVLSDSYPGCQTKWALTKKKFRRLSPNWLVHLLGRS